MALCKVRLTWGARSSLPLWSCSWPAAAATTRTRPARPLPRSETTAAVSGVELDGVKSYLTDHTEKLAGATAEFDTLAKEYDALAKGVDYDHDRLLSDHGDEVSRILADAKERWTEANPYYEQVEGIVAGTPSLAEYDVILDAGSSAEEDPESAVPFDLELSDGRTLEQPGNLFNLTEGMLWGTLPKLTAKAEADLDGDGNAQFGESLPDARVLTAAAGAFKRYADELHTDAQAWEPTASDAFTALVVMVPTMSEYFGQWKESRFVRGDAAESEAFNVVSRLSDINDIISGLQVVYDGVAAGDRRGRRGRRDTDRRGAGRAGIVHLRPARAGGRRQAVHSRAGRSARRRRAAARRRGRGAGLAARGTARGRDPAVTMRRLALLAAVVATTLLEAVPAAAHAPAGWAQAVDTRRDLGSAQTALALGEPVRSRELVARATEALAPITPSLSAQTRREVTAGIAAVKAAGQDAPALARASARLWTTLLQAGLEGAVADAKAGDAAAARNWLLVREYRAPTRFTRAGTDATLAVTGLARGETTPKAAAREVRADLLDTYEARSADHASERRCGGQARIRRPPRRDGRSRPRLRADRRRELPLAAGRGRVRAPGRDPGTARSAALGGNRADVESAVGGVERQLEGFRAAPLAPAEQARRAGQLDRFLRLVPIEYDRGVEGNRVTLAFEIQEAISFRDAAAAALADISPTLLRQDAEATRELTRIVGIPRQRTRCRGRRPCRCAGRSRLGAGGAFARPDRWPLPHVMEGGSRRCGLRRDRSVARPARERRGSG